MKKIFLLIFVNLFLSLSIFGQDNDSIRIMGWPKDAFTMQPVIDGTIAELLTEDSVLIESVSPGWDEIYRQNSSFSAKAPSRSGTYIIRVSHPDYYTIMKKITVRAGKREHVYSIGLLKMRRLPIREKTLGEAIVTATKIKFYTRGDTLIYNADAFNLAEGSMLDALVEQLPGAELKRDGRILVNGKQVESLLLNGKDFFKGDNTILLDNLPAYVVDKVQVYNKRSELSETIGRDVDDGSYVMDLKLKRQYQIGWLNNAEVGLGTKDRWLTRLFALRFTPQSRISLFANLNNINESRKPGRSGEWSPSDIGGGLYTTKTGGMDYMISDKHGRFEVQGEVRGSRIDNSIETRQAAENFLIGGNTFSRQWNDGERSNTSISTDHNLRLNLGPENAISDIRLLIKPKFNYTRTKSWGNSLTAEFRKDPAAYTALRDSLMMSEVGAQLAKILINRTRREQQSNGHMLSGGGAVDLTLSIPHSSDYVSINADVNASRKTDEAFDLYRLEYGSNTDRRHRYFNRPSDNFIASAGVNYSCPLDPDWNWMIMPRLGYVYKHSAQENSLYRLDQLEEMTNASIGVLPSTFEALLTARDTENSYLTTENTNEVTFGFRGRWDKSQSVNGQRIARWRFTWDPRLSLNSDRLHFNGKTNQLNNRTAWLPSVRLELLRNTVGMKHEIEVLADFRQSLPPMFTLLGLRFDSDPLNINEGNSSLHRTSIYSFSGRYRSDQWLNARKQTLSANISANFYHNAIATGYVYNKISGVRTYRPENVNGNWDAAGNVAFSTPLGKKRYFEFRANFSNNYYNNVDLIGIEGTERMNKSTVHTNYLQTLLNLEYSRKKMRLGMKIRLAWNHASSMREGFIPVDAADLSYGIYGQVQLPWEMELASDITCYTRYGYADNLMNSSDFVWNAQLSKRILHNSLTFTLVGFDILSQLSNITYTLNSQARVETWHNVIPSYVMLRVNYRLNINPKNKK